NRAVAGADAQRRAAGAEPSSHAVPAQLAVHVGHRHAVQPDAAVARVCVELRVQVVRNLEDDRPVAGGDVPVLRSAAAGRRADAEAAVAAVRAQRGKAAVGRDAAVAGRDGDVALERARLDAAVARMEIDLAADALDVDAAVAALRRQVRPGRQRDDQLRGSAHVESERMARRDANVHADGVAVLLRVDFDRVGRLLRRGALLDDDLDVLAIPRAHLDRPVEGGHRHLGTPLDGEVLLVARDHASDVGADEVDARRRGERRDGHEREGAEHETSFERWTDPAYPLFRAYTS